MKILIDKYPLGTIPGQRTPGRYIDGTLKQNIDILAKNITKDMTYLGIISSSTLEVGTGKSVFTQQLCEAYLDAVNKKHGFNLNLTMNNIVFRPKDIIKRSFDVPRYSIIICDEWEDANYWSELGTTLRQFFRKCRQLNLFILIIIPNFFQLPMSYAISRSVFFIDVRFSGEFDRGFFSFYNFAKKKRLYLKGKKQQDYGAAQPNFTGRFGDGYVVNEIKYKEEKRKDLQNQEDLEKKPITPRVIISKLFIRVYEYLNKNKKKINVNELSKAFGFTQRTGYRMINEAKHFEEEIFEKKIFEKVGFGDLAHNINNLIGEGEDKDNKEEKDKESILIRSKQ